MALRRSGVRIPLGPLSWDKLAICLTKFKSHGRSSRSSRQREGRARWKPFDVSTGTRSLKDDKTELACPLERETALVKASSQRRVARYRESKSVG